VISLDRILDIEQMAPAARRGAARARVAEAILELADAARSLKARVATLEAQLATRPVPPVTAADLLQALREYRGVESPCRVCGGTGVCSYASTATWRSGAGGCAITSDVCDRCWGSGDETRSWTDLRALGARVAGLEALIREAMPHLGDDGASEVMRQRIEGVLRRCPGTSVEPQSGGKGADRD